MVSLGLLKFEGFIRMLRLVDMIGNTCNIDNICRICNSRLSHTWRVGKMRKNCKITKPEMIANSDNIAKIGKIDNTWHIGKTCSKDARQVRFTWKVAQKYLKQFFLKSKVCHNSQNSDQILGLLFENIGHHELLEIAQSGHTAYGGNAG